MHVPLMFSVFVFWQPDAKILNIKKHMPDAKLPEHLELSRLRYLQHGRESNSWKHRKILCKHISNKEHEKKKVWQTKKNAKKSNMFFDPCLENSGKNRSDSGGRSGCARPRGRIKQFMTGCAGPHRQIAWWVAGRQPKEGLVLGTPYWMPGSHRRSCGRNASDIQYLPAGSRQGFVESYMYI